MQPSVHLFGAITKIDAATHTVEGIITKETLDEQNEIITHAASLAAVEGWRGNIREMHQPSAVGKALDILPDAAAQEIAIRAHIVDPLAWAKVEAGVYTGFSVGGKVLERDPADKRRITKYRLSEVSLVDVPANPAANITLFKLADGAPDADEIAKADGETGTDDAPVTPSEVAAESLEDSAADNDPTVSVPLDTIQEMHNQVVGLGGICGFDYPAHDPMGYILQSLLATLHALGAQCAGADGPMMLAVQPGDLEKAGAAISRANLSRIQAMHDHAAALGAKCVTSDGATKAAPPGDLQKIADAAAPPIPPDEPPLQKALHEQQSDLAKALTQITSMESRIATLEAQPIGGPVLNTAGLRAVSKSLGPGSAPAPDATLAKMTILTELIAGAERGNPALAAGYRQELALLQIKAAQGG